MQNNRLLLLGIVLLVSTYWLHTETFAIQLYDTYFVVSWSVLIGTIGILCLLVGVIRTLINRANVG